MKNIRFTVLVVCFSFGLGGCTVVKVVDTAASATIGAAVGVTKVAVKGTTAAAKVIIPDGDKKKKKK